MKKLLFVAAAALAWSTAPSAAYDLGCTSAVQNWANGSKTTCLFDGGGDGPVHNDVVSGTPTVKCGRIMVNGKWQKAPRPPKPSYHVYKVNGKKVRPPRPVKPHYVLKKQNGKKMKRLHAWVNTH